MRVRWQAGAVLALLIVLGCTLYPFQFSFDRVQGQRVSQLLVLGIGRDRSFDVITNVLLFLPFGVTLAAVVDPKLAAGSAVAAVFLASGVLSYAVEVVQQFVPGRFSSLTDVASNAVGGAIGAAYYLLLRRRRAAGERPDRHCDAEGCPGRKSL